MRSAVVVGAGVSGLACAYRMQQAGVSVTVLERDAGPGGRAQTVREDGYVVDVGPDAMTEGYTHYLALLRELGLGDRVVACSPVIGLVRDGRVIDLDLKRPWALAVSPALSLRAKLRLVRGYVALRPMYRDVDAYELGRSAALDDPETNAWEFGRARFGEELADYLIDPMMRLVTGTGARDASLVNVLGAFKSWMAPLVNVDGGVDVLPRALAERLDDVRYGCMVTGVDETADAVGVRFADDAGAAAVLEADACVITAMYDVAAEIWPPLHAAAPGFESELRNCKLIGVSLGYAAPTRTRSYVVQVPSVEDRNGQLILMQHNKSPDRAPAGHSLATIYTDSGVTDEFLRKSDDELVAWGAGLVEKWCPELAGHRDLGIVSRWPRAAYLADPGFWRRSTALAAALPRDGRVHIAGDLFNASSMESSIRWGEFAAEQVSAGRPSESASAAQDAIGLA